MNHVSIEDRLEYFAQKGLTTGITLRLWKGQIKKVKSFGVTLSNPRPTSRKGCDMYDISFDRPVPDTFSEQLYNMALSYKNQE